MTNSRKSRCHGLPARKTRTFTYNGADLASVTMPETGTTTYTHNADKTVATRVDAKGQRTEYSHDTKARLTQTRFFRWGYSVLQEDLCQRVDYA